MDYEGVLCGVAGFLHVSNPLKFLLVIFTVYVLILEKQKKNVALLHSAQMQIK